MTDVSLYSVGGEGAEEKPGSAQSIRSNPQTSTRLGPHCERRGDRGNPIRSGK